MGHAALLLSFEVERSFMDILDTIRNRRAIRQYKKEAPAEDEIKKVLEAGRWAPSGMNNQPWRFWVIKDNKKKDGLARFTKYGDTIKEAPAVIVVCMDTADSYNRDKDLMAIGACIQNMLLEAHSIGLAACWLGEILNKKSQVHEYLHLDDDLELMAVIAMGYSDEDLTEISRKPLKSLLIEGQYKK
jgi:nitroreductase